MNKIYKDFDEFIQQHKDMLAFLDKARRKGHIEDNRMVNVFRAIWQARQAEIDELKRRMDNLSSEVEKTGEDHRFLQDKSEQYQKEIDDLNIEVSDLRSQVERLRGIQDRLKDLVRKTTENAKQADEDIRTLNLILEEYGQKNYQQQSNIESLQKERDELRLLVEQHKNEKQKVETDMMKLRSTLKDVQSLIKNLSGESNLVRGQSASPTM